MRTQPRTQEPSGGKKRRGKAIAEAAVGTGMALYGATTDLPQSDPTPLRDEATVMSYGERNRRSDKINGATRDKGQRTGDSSQQR